MAGRQLPQAPRGRGQRLEARDPGRDQLPEVVAGDDHPLVVVPARAPQAEGLKVGSERLRGGGVFGDLAGPPAAQLVVLPGTTHVGLLDRAEWLLAMIPPFLDAPLPGAA